jgi:hypothetical protein
LSKSIFEEYSRENFEGNEKRQKPKVDPVMGKSGNLAPNKIHGQRRKSNR